MKRKFYNGLLLVAMLFMAAGSFVSCKDYDEDAYADLRGQLVEQNANLVEIIEAQKKALETLLDAKLGESEENNRLALEAEIKNLREEIQKWTQLALEGYVTTKEFEAHVDKCNDQIDIYNNFIAEFGTYKDGIQNQFGDVYTAIEEANSALESGLMIELLLVQEKLNSTISSSIATLESNFAAKLSDAIAANKAEIEAGYNSAIAASQSVIAGEIEALQSKLNEAIAGGNKDLENTLRGEIQALEDKLAARISELESWKASAETRLSSLESSVANNEKAIAKLQDDLGGLAESVGNIQDLLNKTVHDVVKAQALAERDSIRIDALENRYALLESMNNEEHDALEARIDSICNVLKDQQGINENLDAKIDSVYNVLLAANQKMGDRIDSINNNLTIIKKEVSKALELANENLEKANEYTDKRIEYVMGNIAGIHTTLDDLKASYMEADEALQAQIDELKSGLADLEERVKKNEENIDALLGLNEKVNDIDESLKQFITGIILQRAENPVFGSFAFPANIQTNVLMAYYGYAGSYGVQFPTYYPRYYVRAAEALSVKDIEMLGITPETLVEDGDAIIGNAGKVYVTVNPSNVNFEGQVLPIVNSIEEESGVKLSPLKYSDKKLTFGATRSAVNGLYEADATLDANGLESVKMRFDLNVGDVKETIKDVINPTDGVNVSRLASTMVNVLSQFNQTLDANALKASWTDSLGVSRSVYSQYNLATTAIKPLSYAFMNDVNISSFPGFDRIRNLSGRLIDKISNRIQLVIPNFPIIDLHADKITELHFDSIKINTSDINLDLTVRYKDTIMTSVEVSIDHFVDIDIEKLIEVGSMDIYVDVPVKGDVKDDHENVIGKFETLIEDYKITIPAQDVMVSIQEKVPFKWTGMVPVEVPVDIEIPVDMEEFKKLLAEVDAMEDDINGLLAGQQDKVNKIIKTVNDYLERLGDLTDLEMKLADIDNRIDAQFDIIKDKIIKFLDKTEDVLVTGVNSINKVLQPVMLVKTTDGFHKLSQTIYTPTVMTSGDVQFIPTSYNAEIVAPAYKKLVGVTNVFSMDRSKHAQAGDSDCLNVLKAANAKAGVAEVINGDTNVVAFSAKKGYIYEVTYTSVDYSGLVVARKYYVTVK
ncbi:MAG: hypothetical protein IKU76_07460 [Bacteroidaceae bacterium]|nr:hypothetical protein [Bacteroidaceae bacterium]